MDELKRPDKGWANFETDEQAMAWLEEQMPYLNDARLRDPRVTEALTPRQLEVAQAIYAESAEKVKRECLGEAHNTWYGGTYKRDPQKHDSLIDRWLMRINYHNLYRRLEIQESSIASHVRAIEDRLAERPDLGRWFLWHRESRSKEVCPSWPCLLQMEATERAARQDLDAWMKRVNTKLDGNRCLSLSTKPTVYGRTNGAYELHFTFNELPERAVVEVLADRLCELFVSPGQYDQDTPCWAEWVQREEPTK